MKIQQKLEIENTDDGYKVSFFTDKNEADNLYAIVNALQSKTDYDLIVKRRPKDKTADANAYAWKLISLISAEIGLTPTEVCEASRDFSRVLPNAAHSRTWCGCPLGASDFLSARRAKTQNLKKQASQAPH